MTYDEEAFRIEQRIARRLVSCFPLLLLASLLFRWNAELWFWYEVDCLRFQKHIRRRIDFTGWLYHRMKTEYGL